ncbi:protein FAM151B isoform X2 [Megachile rotundata]|uniref:protein FAM151B isoform X2 n=1 Tax=Megachile rotundata TaxID=143995 RepID=UPI000258F19C|nr:PREDICTED: protein FAM151B isoform X1 [Megachile rotundata]
MKGATTTVTSLLLLAAFQAAMCDVSTDPKSYFPQIKGNLTQIVWAHAVNSQADLAKALESAEIMMLEADVVLGKHNSNSSSTNTSQTIPIMAHPPKTESDLSLQEFLMAVIDKKNVSKGIKLDFKTTDAFNASKLILDNLRNDMKFPVFLNADILPGPLNANATPVDAKQFVSQAKMVPNCTLSLGWTTNYVCKNDSTDCWYTEEQVQQMIDLVKEQNVSQPITYPVRAGLVANNVTTIKSLLEKSSNLNKDVTLTIWSSDGDTVNAKELSSLIKDVGVEKVYVDVPKDLMEKLNISAASSIGVTAMTMVVSLITVFISTIM